MNTPDTPQLSVVIPAYNEAAVIATTLTALHDYLDAERTSHEIIVVDDGSQDTTRAIALAHATQDPRVRVLSGPHRGKGGAVKTGVLEARGTWVLFMDADRSTPIAQWAHFRPHLEQGAAVVIGSRKTSGATVEVHQPALRETLGKIFTWLSNRLAVRGVSDVTCGFKSFRTDVAQQIFARQRLDGWAFDAEVLFIAQHLGHPIVEVPVVWRNDPSTKVHMARDAVQSLADLLRIRIGSWRGYYPRAD